LSPSSITNWGSYLKIAVLADIHGNYDALKAVLKNTSDTDMYLILGDLVDYGPEPEQVIDAIKELGCLVVRGNHDHAVAHNVDCRCGVKTHWVSVVTREVISKKYLSKKNMKYLKEMPLRLELYLNNLKVLLVHATPSNPLYQYLYPWEDTEKFFEALAAWASSRCIDMVLLAHTHYQFIRIVEGVLVLNPGSVGQPRDGDPRAAYAIIDTESREVYLRRIKYDVEATLSKLRKLLSSYRKEYEFLSKLLRRGLLD